MVYYPANPIFKKFTKKVVHRLGLQGADAVNTTDALAQAMVHRQVFVCIEYKHDAVSVFVICKNKTLFQKAKKNSSIPFLGAFP